MNNSSIIPAPPTLARYNVKLDLVEVRRNPAAFPRIKDTEYKEAVEKMTEIVYAAFFYRGQEIIVSQIKLIASALVAELMADTKYGLKNISWTEIGVAVRAAVLGAGKEMFGVSVASLYAAILDYVNGEGHQADRKARGGGL